MSQVRQRRNITEITGVNLGQTINITSVATVVGTAISSVTDNAIKELMTGSVNMSATTISSSMVNTVQSPIALRNTFAGLYTKAMSEITEDVDTVTKQKMAVIKTLSSGNYKVLSPKTIETGIQEVMKATATEKLSAVVEKMMNTVQTEHNTIFTQSIASVVKQASIATGFTSIEVKQIEGQISVVALNENGQSIITDVKVDNKTQRVDLVSETIGIKDKSCDTILNKFDRELEKAGLKYRKPDIKWKEGVQWMPDNPVKRSIPSVRGNNDQKDKLKKLIQKNIKH